MIISVKLKPNTKIHQNIGPFTGDYNFRDIFNTTTLGICARIVSINVKTQMSLPASKEISQATMDSIDGEIIQDNNFSLFHCDLNSRVENSKHGQ